MSEPMAYLNGHVISASQVAVSVSDQGFLLGVTVAEQLRTFGGKLFRLEEHLKRLDHSLEIVGVEPGHSHEAFTRIAEEIVRHNHRLLAEGDDLGLTIFVTPGEANIEKGEGGRGKAEVETANSLSAFALPTVCLHTRLIPFHHWAHKYESGESLATTDVQQVSSRSWPPELKCRSRMHYYLADRQAAARWPGSRAVMLDEDGFVVEATTANVLVYRQSEGLLTPPCTKILPGISLSVVSELAAQLQIPLVQRDLRPDDLATADEVLLCSTSPCVLSVTRFNGQPVGSGRPGEVQRQLLGLWSKSVNIDIAEQARKFASRRSGFPA